MFRPKIFSLNLFKLDCFEYFRIVFEIDDNKLGLSGSRRFSQIKRQNLTKTELKRS